MESMEDNNNKLMIQNSEGGVMTASGLTAAGGLTACNSALSGGPPSRV